ncbi:MAG: AlkA N-terminal domain-containing protein [Egibacteraceae bacterium]
MDGDLEQRYRAIQSRDPRFDGWFFVGVATTGIYCRPSCPAMTPQRRHARFFPTSGAAHRAGFRACKRCQPDATPGSPEWNLRADLVGRAMGLIADGVVDRDGVEGLARRLGYSARHVHRLLTAEVGAGPTALARAQRAQTARTLVERTELPFARVALAAGFASVRQFNETVRAVFAATPTALRTAARRRQEPTTPGVLTLRLPYRAPSASGETIAFLVDRAIEGVERGEGASYRRSLDLPRAEGVVELTPAEGHVRCRLRLADFSDLSAAVRRCRRLLDLDADPVATDRHLAADPLLAPLVAGVPGRRVPGAVDGWEIAVRAVVGQQISVRAARTILARLVAAHGHPLATPEGNLTHQFPRPEAVEQADLAQLGLPHARRETLRLLAVEVARGALDLDGAADREETVARLRTLPGVGPWTAGYIRMRALADPDVFLPTDAAVRRALRRLGQSDGPQASAERARRWRPWRSYALMHLWAGPLDTNGARS